MGVCVLHVQRKCDTYTCGLPWKINKPRQTQYLWYGVKRVYPCTVAALAVRNAASSKQLINSKLRIEQVWNGAATHAWGKRIPKKWEFLWYGDVDSTRMDSCVGVDFLVARGHNS